MIFTFEVSFPLSVTYLNNALCSLLEKYIPLFPSTVAILGFATPAHAQALFKNEILEAGPDVLGQVISLQMIAEEGKQCALRFMSEEELFHFFTRIPKCKCSLNSHISSKNQSIIKILASFRFKTTYLDVSHALNHKKAMIHITLKSFCKDFQNSVMRHPKVKIGVKKHLRERTK